MEGIQACTSQAGGDDDPILVREYTVYVRQCGKYARIAGGIWCLLSGGPSSMRCARSWSASSAAVAIWTSSYPRGVLEMGEGVAGLVADAWDVDHGEPVTQRLLLQIPQSGVWDVL